MIELKEGQVYICHTSLSLYWSNRSGYTTGVYTKGKEYPVKKWDDGLLSITENSGYLRFGADKKHLKLVK